jgi:hypothetical protein
LSVSIFRLRARIGFSIHLPSLASEAQPRLWIYRSSFERQRDFNPPEQCAAQRTLTTFAWVSGDNCRGKRLQKVDWTFEFGMVRAEATRLLQGRLFMSIAVWRCAIC